MALLVFGLAAAILLAIVQFLKVVLRERRSPLAAIPAASPLAPYSRLFWAFVREHIGQITLDLPKLHAQKGPLVRIGPNEVSFYSVEVYDEVHRVGNRFKKDPRVYGEFVQDGSPALFSITDPQEHAKRRRMMGQLYNRSKMDNLDELMLHHIAHFIADAKKQPQGDIDLAISCRALEADIMSDFSFGNTIGAVDAWSKGSQLGMVQANDTKATWMPVMTNFPNLCSLWEQAEDLLDLIGCRSKYSSDLKKFDEWSLSQSQHILAAKPLTQPNLLQTLVRSGLHPETALSEAKENLGPGTDTTSASFAHLVWALSYNQHFQDVLYDDLAAVGFATDMTTLEGVPRLRALVKESIRWAGAAAAMLPRVVPAGGVELAGHFVPEGVVLTSSPIWYLMDPVAFPQPELFDPGRWMEKAEGTSTTLRDRYYLPFSKGPNVCIGSHFAYYELYLSTSQIVKHFRIRRSEKTVTPYDAVQSEPVTSAGWRPVKLPARKEWVAAVVTEPLVVKMEKR